MSFGFWFRDSRCCRGLEVDLYTAGKAEVCNDVIRYRLSDIVARELLLEVILRAVGRIPAKVASLTGDAGENSSLWNQPEELNDSRLCRLANRAVGIFEICD